MRRTRSFWGANQVPWGANYNGANSLRGETTGLQHFDACALIYSLFSHGVFKQPMTCQDGHSFCKDCITQWQRVNTHCPVDRSTLDRPLVRNLAVEGSIGRKLMKCPSTVSLPGGCSWTGLASAVEQHLLSRDMNVVECKSKVRTFSWTNSLSSVRLMKGSMSGSVKFVWMSLDRPTLSIRLLQDKTSEDRLWHKKACEGLN